MLDQVVAQDGGDRHLADAGRRLGLDHAFLHVPRSLHADDSAGQVDVAPAERDQLASTETGVEGRRPQCPELGRRSLDQLARFGGRRESFPSPADRRQLDAGRGIDLDLASRQRPTADRPQRHQRVAGGGSFDLARRELVSETLDVLPAERMELRAAQLRQHVLAHRLLVATQRRRLVAVAGTVADASILGACQPRLGELPERGRRRRDEHATTEVNTRILAPLGAAASVGNVFWIRRLSRALNAQAR